MRRIELQRLPVTALLGARCVEPAEHGADERHAPVRPRVIRRGVHRRDVRAAEPPDRGDEFIWEKRRKSTRVGYQAAPRASVDWNHQ
jgi:hypothetical protein